jgi:hypothetical protein
MRAPSDKKMISLPSFAGVPEYSPVERACRHVGEAPQGSALRRSLQRSLGELIRRRGDINSRDLRALIAYVKGEFDRKPEHGRPFDPWRHHATSTRDDIVRQIQREQKCDLRRAIDLAAPLLELDAAAARRLWKRLTR